MGDIPAISDHPADARLEMSVDGHRAELIYRRHGDRLVLVHTGVPAELEGHGYGGALIEAALCKAEAENLTVVPLCPFARSWLERHPEAAARVKIIYR
jgi:predicted GNAT family acetyltransferase